MGTLFRTGYFGLIFFSLHTAAQQPLRVPRNIRKAYAKGTRIPQGMPGPKYWQNTANYDIRADFDPQNRLLKGTEDIVYFNESPDTLHEIWFKIYPNFYKKGTPRTMSVKPGDLTDGMHFEKLMVNGETKDTSEIKIDGTNMTMRMNPLLPHQQIHMTIAWSYVLNEGSHVRTGEVENGSYVIAYFFPRIAVYDDVDGWNRYGYNGTQEFYNDFCNFKVSLTVPKNYIVWATGVLENPGEVLADKYVKRLEEAEKLDRVTDIIDTADLKSGGITPGNTAHTWTFSARNVTDFVWATSDHYVWKSTSLVVDPKTGRRARVDAVYDPLHQDYADVVNFARKTVQAMSYTFPAWPYPYPHETIYDGLDQMEYPMMVNDNPLEDRASSIELTDHEIFHTMFPFFMGINETKYAFMDEGWATMGEWIISPLIDDTLVDPYGMKRYDAVAGDELDVPIMTLSTDLSDMAYYINSYPKPALGYLYVRDLLGEKLFTRALHEYITRWQGKHPTPLDFFNSMNAGSGKNLNWFWQKWFFRRGYPDLAIQRVVKRTKGYEVTVASIGDMPTPVDLTFNFADGSVQKLHRSVTIWEKDPHTITLRLDTPKELKEIVLGGTYDADTDPGDNTYRP